MLRSASGARADISESFTSAISEQQMGTSGDLSALSSRKASLAAPPSPVGRSGLVQLWLKLLSCGYRSISEADEFSSTVKLLRSYDLISTFSSALDSQQKRRRMHG